jgi:adenosylhomocysteine nucleosidase
MLTKQKLTTRTSKALAVVLISLLLLNSSGHSKSQTESSQPTIALLGAFWTEVELLEEQVTDARVQKIEGMRFVTGKLKDRNVVVAYTGIGKVNAAMTTTLLLEHFKPREVIFTGIAGACNPQLHPGDIVMAEMTAHHDMGRLTADGFVPRGVINPLDAWRNPVLLPADKHLLNRAQKAAEQVKLEPIETAADQRSLKIVTGIVVTGDVFVSSSEKCAELRQQFKADAVEMEGAAVAQICYQRSVPHIVIRSISDKADEQAIYDARVFQYLAAKNSSALVIEILAVSDS